MQLTPHFELREFEVSQEAVRRGINNTIPPEYLDNVKTLACTLEQVRLLVKAPIIISSGYRCIELNKIIGGNPRSRHLYALAADFHVPGYSVKEVVELIQNSWLKYDQLINEFGAWVHLSIPFEGEEPRMQCFDLV